jgi:RNA polymerase sigma factor for flagellar operon FliA
LSSIFDLSADSAGDAVRRLSPDQLARENAPLAKFLAVEKARTAQHVDLDDLMSAAHLGLAKAALEYDPDRGIPFGAYARSQINWAMLDEMRAADPAGERGRAKIQRVKAAEDAVLARTGRTATIAELAKESGLDVDAVAQARQLDDMVRTATSFEAHFDAEDGRQAVDLTDSIILPEHAAERSETRAMLLRVLEALPAATQHIIRGVYIEDRSVKDIAAELDVSHAYVSKLRSSGLALMREAMQEWETGEVAERSTKARSAFFQAVFGDRVQEPLRAAS